MFEELTKHINKPITLLLKNGKEKHGRLVYIDSDDQTITFEDESTMALSFVKSILSGSKPAIATVLIPVPELIVEPTPTKEIEPIEEEEVVAIVDTTPQEVLPPPTPKTEPEVLEKVAQINAFFQKQIAEAQLPMQAPEFNGMPAEIKRIDEMGKSEEAKMWTNILNQYHDGIKLGKFLPKSDKLDKLFVHVRNLSASPYLQNFLAIPQLLGYLHYLNDEKREALEYMKQIVKMADTPENWVALAIVAIECGENELACFTLKKMLFKANFTEEKFTKIWYKFIDLVIRIKAYNDFFMIFSSKYRHTPEEEKQGILEAVCYFMLKNRQRKDAEDLITAAFTPQADIKTIALDALKKIGHPDREYEPEQTEQPHQENTLPAKPEKIILPPQHKTKSIDTTVKVLSQYTFSSTIYSLREGYGFIKYSTNNLFFHSYDLLNCNFLELSEGDQVEFKMKKGIKGNEVACEIKLMHEPRKKIQLPIITQEKTIQEKITQEEATQEEKV